MQRRQLWRRRAMIPLWLWLLIGLVLLGVFAARLPTGNPPAPSIALPPSVAIPTPLPTATRPPEPDDEAGQPTVAPLAAATPDNIQAHVYHPARLKILDPTHPLRTVTALVKAVAGESDGDYHIELELNPADLSLLNSGNQNRVDGWLIAEIMPSDTSLPVPKVGDSVTITGVWVFDSNHGWNELHPLQSVAISGGGSGAVVLSDKVPLSAQPAAKPTYDGKYGPLPYDPFGRDRNCSAFRTHDEAQRFFLAAGGPDKAPHRLDGDHDGIACESLPLACQTADKSVY